MAGDFNSFYKTVGGGEGSRCLYPTRLDMYGKGCQHNCTYCYARSLLEFRGNWDAQEPSQADREEVSKVLDTIEKGTIIRLGGMTDPFQPAERERKHTRWLIEQLNDRGIGYLIVTKGAGLLKDNEDVLDKKLAHIQISYTYTDGRGVPTDFERASPPRERIDVADYLYGQGYDIAIRLSPFIPQYVDVQEVVKAETEKVQAEFLRFNGLIRKRMPEYDFTAWTLSAGGYRHLPLSAKKGLLKPLIDAGKQVSVCEDYPPHYKWFKENVNHNRDDCCNLLIL